MFNALFTEDLFDDGVSALLDMGGAIGVDGRFAVVPFASELCPADEEVDFCEGLSGFAEWGGLCENFFYEITEERFFVGDGAFFGVKDFLFFFLKVVGVEAFGVGGSLFTGVVKGDEIEVGFGDFDEVTEGVVEFYFEVFDAGFLTFGFFEIGDPRFVVAHEGAHVIEVGVVSVLDVSAVFEFGREVFFKGGGEEFLE